MKFNSFLQNSAGNVAVVFSLAAVPLIIGVGAASDMMRANDAQILLQTATDAAALAGASGKNLSMSDGQLKTLVDNYIATNHVGDKFKSVAVKDSGYDKNTGVFRVRLTGKINTTFMAMAGIPTLEIGSYSEVELGAGALEVALVLDNTGSMNSEGRLDALKVAAKDLVDKLLKDKPTDAYVKIGMVPFADYVNVGVNNRNKFWVDAPLDYQKNECWDTYPNVSYSNCHMVDQTCNNDGVSYACQQNVCDVNYGAAVQQCGLIDHKWYGVVGSRNGGLDTKVVGTGSKYPGLMDAGGPQAITEMTDNVSTLNTNIANLTANSETYIPSGLLWGWELVSSVDAFAGVKTTAEMAAIKGTKAIVLMTDGDNTRSADYPYHWGADAVAADQKTAELCTNIKKDGVSIYTVAFKVGKPTSKQMLIDCASSPAQAYDAADNTALLAAFGDIAGKLQQIRLTK